jgi:hypothetical protein
MLKALRGSIYPSRRLVLTIGLAVFCLVVMSERSFAQTKGAKAQGQEKRTTINFEDQLIEGQTSKPELFYAFSQHNPNLKRLIKLRENFIPEMRKTSEDVSSSGDSKSPKARAN